MTPLVVSCSPTQPLALGLSVECYVLILVYLILLVVARFLSLKHMLGSSLESDVSACWLTGLGV